MTRRLAGVLAAACGVAAYGAACSDIPSDPKTPFAIELRSPGSPGVARGDTLRDSLGLVARLRAVAFNSSGDSIPGADVTYHVVPVTGSATVKYDSTPARIDASGRLVIARSERVFVTRTFRVYAQAGGLQTVPIVFTVTRTPDTLVAGRDTTFMLRFPDTLPQIPLVVRLRHRARTDSGDVAADTTVPAWLVRYTFVKPDSANRDTTYLMFTGGKRGVGLDTTDASGVASRSVRIRYTAFPFGKAPKPGTDTIYDTVMVQARAYAPGGADVPGSPHDFTIIIKALKLTAP